MQIETICMKYQSLFSEEKKKISSLLNVLPSMLCVKGRLIWKENWFEIVSKHASCFMFIYLSV